MPILWPPVTADDGSYYDEANYISETCDECGKKFSVQVSTETTWFCEPIDLKE